MSYFPASDYSGMGSGALRSIWGRQASLRYMAREPMSTDIEWWFEDGRQDAASRFMSFDPPVPYECAHRAAAIVAGTVAIGSNSWI